MANDPTPTRPRMKGYGVAEAKSPPGERFPWSEVREMLESARNYWVGTTRPDGRPHAAPVWGLWADGVLYFSTWPQSLKARNFQRDPRVSVHVERGDAAVIVEGAVEEVSERPLLERFLEIYNPKYSWDFTMEQLEEGGVYAVRPGVVLSFREEIGETATRWAFS